MKRELKHDILAEKIWERLPEQDKELRRVRRSIAQRAADYAAGSGSLAGEPELLNWQALAGKLKLEPQEERFIEQSWEAVLAQKEEEQHRVEELREQARREKRLRENAQGRTRIAWIVSIIALVAAGFAIWLYGEAQNARLAAEEKRIEAEQSDSLAQEKTLQAQRSDSIARENARKAVLKALEAQVSDSIARLKTVEALQNLNDLEQASEEVVSLLIADAKALVYHLNYEEALEKLRTAVPLNAKKDEVAKGLFEMAFFYNEAGKYDLALSIADAVAVLKKDQRAKELLSQSGGKGNAHSFVDSVLSIILPAWHEAMMERYYPVMMPVEGGEFCMSRYPSETGDCDTSQYPLVTLESFQLAETETTVWQFYLFSFATGWGMKMPSWGWDGDNPVVNVNWYDAARYANWVNQQKGLDTVYNFVRQIDKDDWEVTLNEVKGAFRLPTEAEWEYAARGGVQQDTFIYSGGDSLSLDSVAWHRGNSDEGYGIRRTHVVATKKVNTLGLYDMSGNVWEWCWDWYLGLESGTFPNPLGPESGSGRVLRGGSWYDGDSWVYRVDIRSYYYPNGRDDGYGFRFAQD